MELLIWKTKQNRLMLKKKKRSKIFSERERRKMESISKVCYEKKNIYSRKKKN